MMKLRRYCLAIGLVALQAGSVSVRALELNDLSPEARKLLPDKSAVTVVLRDGTTVEGRLVAQTDQEVSVRVTEGTISSLKKLPRAQIKEITPLDVATGFAKALVRFRLDPKISYPAAEYEKALTLFDEFLTKCPDHPQRDDITKLRAAFAGELDLVRQGCEKINGQWETPIRGAILKFDLCTARMAELRKEHPGVERADFRGPPQVRTAYLELEQKQRDIARDLPKIMRDRMPVLLEAGKFDEAVAEVNAFLRFWILRVLRSEAAAADRVRLGQDLFAGMDFNYILRLEKQVLSTYTNAGHGGVPTGVTVAADAAYIPGGYFLMGREDADPASDDFPLRLVSVKPFLMDRYEVSNRQYREFVEYVRRTGDSSMEHPLAPPLKDHTPVGWKYPALSRDEQPVVGVDWFDAYAYAKWAGKRLPTEAEWEKAARGLDARLYPWGNDESGKRLVNCPTGRRAVAAEIDRRKPPPPEKRSWLSCVRRKPPEPPPPTVLPDETWDVNQTLPPQALTNVWGTLDYEPPESPYGVVHLAGNAAEWVADWYDPTYYVTGAVENPLGPESGQVHVFRGGSYLDDGPELLSTRRGFPKNDQMKKGCAPDGRPMVGIRCVRDLPVTP